jgi:hypothetical protein
MREKEGEREYTQPRKMAGEPIEAELDLRHSASLN